MHHPVYAKRSNIDYWLPQLIQYLNAKIALGLGNFCFSTKGQDQLRWLLTCKSLVLRSVHADETLSGYRKSKVIVNSAFNMFSDCLRVGSGRGRGGRSTRNAVVACSPLICHTSYHTATIYVEKLGFRIEYQDNTQINRFVFFTSFRPNSSIGQSSLQK